MAAGDRVLKIEKLRSEFLDRCLRCGFYGRMEWQVTDPDGAYGFLCAECGQNADKEEARK